MDNARRPGRRLPGITHPRASLTRRRKTAMLHGSMGLAGPAYGAGSSTETAGPIETTRSKSGVCRGFSGWGNRTSDGGRLDERKEALLGRRHLAAKKRSNKGEWAGEKERRTGAAVSAESVIEKKLGITVGLEQESRRSESKIKIHARRVAGAGHIGERRLQQRAAIVDEGKEDRECRRGL